jgi:hypothetical protein
MVPSEVRERAAGLRCLGILLTVWGMLLQAVGTADWLGVGQPDRRFGPTLVSRSSLFAVSGALLAVAGAWTGLATLSRAERSVALSRSIEAAFLGLGVGLLLAGIFFHHPRRDPWVVGGLILLCAGAVAARHWSRARGRGESRIAPR